MSRIDYRKFNIRLLTCIFLLLGLCGCTYQAKLLDHQQFETGATVAIQCNVIKKPIIKVSEAGDFIFWAGGPGPLTWSIAQVVNASNNNRYRKMLQPALETDYFCEKFQANLKEAIEETGLQVERVSIEHKNAGIPGWSNLRDFDISEFSPENGGHKYVLQLKISCGLFKSEAQSVAQIEGRLIRVADNKVIWKNKLSFEGQAAAEHKAFGDGKEAVKQWKKDHIALRNCLLEVVAGVTNLLAQEFAATGTKQHQLTKLKLKDGSKIKGSIIDKSEQRLVVRLEGGSVRSMPVEKSVKYEAITFRTCKAHRTEAEE